MTIAHARRRFAALSRLRAPALAGAAALFLAQGAFADVMSGDTAPYPGWSDSWRLRSMGDVPCGTLGLSGYPGNACGQAPGEEDSGPDESVDGPGSMDDDDSGARSERFWRPDAAPRHIGPEDSEPGIMERPEGRGSDDRGLGGPEAAAGGAALSGPNEPVLDVSDLGSGVGSWPSKAGRATVWAAKDVAWRSGNAWSNGGWDVYLPFYAWHPAWVYSSQQRADFHDKAWGLGVGKSWEDARGNQDLIYAMAFIESHGHVEPIAGYARQWFTAPIAGSLRLGGGYTVGVTSRPDVMSGVPFPLALPVVSAQAGRFSLMSAIVPGAGGIRAALVWARVRLGDSPGL
jgi:lipid IVA palmitoyltransferase